MIRILEENIHAVIGDTTEYKISEINNLLEEKQKEGKYRISENVK